ncbi:hypothetical protein QE152_g928 [Popillia japonica]|uniref:Uncharacterized protein n=1 Tax=Popillia japonica TaxID=7064 RepID=A0AAW1N4R6_POPJA
MKARPNALDGGDLMKSPTKPSRAKGTSSIICLGKYPFMGSKAAEKAQEQTHFNVWANTHSWAQKQQRKHKNKRTSSTSKEDKTYSVKTTSLSKIM